MKTTALRCSLWLFTAALCISVMAGADEHVSPQTVRLPAEVKSVFLAQMQGHIIGVDGIMNAIAEGDYANAAAVARESMGIPREAGDDLSGSVEGGVPGPGLGLGKHLPKEMIAIGSDFHKAANALAEHLDRMAVTANTESHAQLYRALANVTTQCRRCHERFNIE